MAHWRLILCGLLLLPAACRSNGEAQRETVVIKGTAFVCDVARDFNDRQRGLMERPVLPMGRGMLFIFPDSAVRSFWMAQCPADIDVAFLDAHGVVTAVHEMVAEPPRGDDEPLAAYEARLLHYSSGLPAQFAVEMPPGSIQMLALRPNDIIKLDLERLKRLAR